MYDWNQVMVGYHAIKRYCQSQTSFQSRILHLSYMVWDSFAELHELFPFSIQFDSRGMRRKIMKQVCYATDGSSLMDLEVRE